MRVLIVDDDAIVVRSLATILSAQEDIEVVGCGSSGEEAVALHRELSPDAILMDIRMTGRDGLQAAEEILADSPEARIVLLTTFSDDEYIVRALKLGVRGYLIKQDVACIAPALRSVMAGQRVLEGEVLERAASLGRSGGEAADRRPAPCRDDALASLTEREREVVRAVADGLGNAQIAKDLCMGEGTVRNHISSILAKLGLRNRTQIAVFFYRTCV